MAEETEVVEVEETPDTPPDAAPPAAEPTPEPAEPVAPPPPPPPPAAQPAAAAPQLIDMDAALAEKEALATQLEAATISYEDYAKKAATIDRTIAKAHRQMIEPARQVQQVYQQQENARKYWQTWGQGQDVAQLQFGAKINGATAKANWDKVAAEIAANPRYQRPEFQDNPQRLEGIIYDRWMDSLAAESTKKPAPPTGKAPAAAARPSGSGGAAAGPSGAVAKTARQKLEDGEYDLTDEAKRLGML